MAHHVPYPPLSIECLQDVARIVRAKAFKAERKLLVKCTWMLGGTGLKYSVGEPDEPEPGPFGAADVPREALRDCHAALIEAQAQAGDDPELKFYAHAAELQLEGLLDSQQAP